MSQGKRQAEKLSGEHRPVRLRLLDAAGRCLQRDGYAGLSTRAVAVEAATQLSQIHYHFGSKRGLVLALLQHRNDELLDRQGSMLGSETPLSCRWQQSCDFLEDDLRSGYVRVLQEIVASGYSDPELAAAARQTLKGWFVLLRNFAIDLRSIGGASSEVSADQLSCLIGLAFLGAETMLLVDTELPVIASLRAVGSILSKIEGSQEEDAAHAG